MSDIAIKVENVSKKYRLGERGGYRTIRDSFSKLSSLPRRWFKRGNQANHTNPCNPSQVETAGTTALADAPGNASDADLLLPVSETADDRLTSSPASTANSVHANDPADPNTFWALRDVSFEVKRGEVLGIIGRNGAGKSTLLKILSRITEPTTGRIDLYGRVASLLEVGTGFHPELTGRENIYLNGAILGMTRTEINRQFEAIIDFAGVEKFLDTPVKRYSSGMRVRLGFAVAAHLEPEILIVDEVLAVGDQEFQNKCLGKMDDVARSGRTVLFVSHNMAAVEVLCTRAILIHNGEITADGQSDEIITAYLNAGYRCADEGELRTHPGRTSQSVPVFTKISMTRTEPDRVTNLIAPGNDAIIELRLNASSPIEAASIAIRIFGGRGERLATIHSRWSTLTPLIVRGETAITCILRNLRLAPGRYGLSLALKAAGINVDEINNAAYFDVVPSDVYGTGRLPTSGSGCYLPEVDWAWRSDL